MFFCDDVTGFLLALGYLKDFGLFIVYQLTQPYFCLYFLPNNTVYSFAHWQAATVCSRSVILMLFVLLSAYKILLQTEEDRLTVVVNQGLLTLSDVSLFGAYVC